MVSWVEGLVRLISTPGRDGNPSGGRLSDPAALFRLNWDRLAN